METLRGCSSVNLYNSISCESKAYDDLVAPTANRTLMGTIMFRDWLTANELCHSVVKQIQPKVLDRISFEKQIVRIMHRRSHLRDIIGSTLKRGRPEKERDFVQIWSLLACGWLCKEVAREYGCCDKSITKIKLQAPAELRAKFNRSNEDRKRERPRFKIAKVENK